MGDVLVLEAPGRVVTLVARRARFEAAWPRPAVALASLPAELVPYVRAARGRGTLAVREHVLPKGQRVRLAAHVERVSSVGASASARVASSVGRYVVRDDLGPVVLYVLS
jgi:hypothetical protein